MVEFTAEEIERHWRERAERDGLARVMRASQPPALAEATTAATRELVADWLEAVGGALGRPVGRALEIGCGMGRLTPTIARRAGRVVALDMTAEMVELAERECAGLGNVEFHRVAAQLLPFGGERFDVAVCVWVLMHVLPEDELASVCAAIAAATRYLVLVEYEAAAIPVGPFSRLRPFERYLDLLPGAKVVERRELLYGGDRSFAALFAFDDA
jgi:2-polyprenyl-3-methyl-5-hydroxy-6-metoxy-1,4-benzoquinol methylase